MEFIDLKAQYKKLKEEIDQNIQNVLDTGHYIGGEEVKQLEKELADYCGTKYCLTCANGTDALTLALKCFNITAKDAIFLPSFTFFATAETVSQEGAKVIFVDVEKDTFNIDPEKLKKAIEDVKKEGKYNLKGIVTVDLFGLPADYKAIRKIANEYNMFILEDGAQGFGGSINGKKACSFGDISTTSFFPAKPLGCYGDGGAIFTDNEEYYKILCSLAVHGKGDFKYDNIRLGFNSRLDTIQAAILLPKLKAFKEYELVNRNKIANEYTRVLKNSFTTPTIKEGYISSWAQYTLILDSCEEREKIQAALKKENIPSMVYYPKPMHEQTVYKGYDYNLPDLAISNQLSKTVLSIPMHPYLLQEDIEKITNILLNTKKV